MFSKKQDKPSSDNDEDCTNTISVRYGLGKKYENDPYERRAFLYLDVLSWLESKIENRPKLK